LPVQHVADARGMIGSIIGLVTLLLALVLGLLVWTSYGVYTNQNSESQSLGPLILKLDFALEQYGPEARRGRDLSRAAVVRATLEPTTDQQKQIITTAMPNFMQVVETTLLMTRQLANPVPKLLLFVVIGWSALLFMGFGLLGTFNALSVAIEALGSIAVASAVFMILEFQPAVFRPVSHFAGRRRQSHRHAWPLRARRRSHMARRVGLVRDRRCVRGG
jgi:hypothetical protein